MPLPQDLLLLGTQKLVFAKAALKAYPNRHGPGPLRRTNLEESYGVEPLGLPPQIRFRGGPRHRQGKLSNFLPRTYPFARYVSRSCFLILMGFSFVTQQVPYWLFMMPVFDSDIFLIVSAL